VRKKRITGDKQREGRKKNKYKIKVKGDKV
jgi:hypothetical protein